MRLTFWNFISLFSVFKSIIFPITRHQKKFFIDPPDNFLETIEISIDIWVGEPKQKVSLHLYTKDFSGIWLNRKFVPDGEAEHEKIYYYPNISSTFQFCQMETGFFLDQNFVTAKVGKESFLFEDIKSNQYSLNEQYFLLDKHNNRKYYYKKQIGGMIGLSLNPHHHFNKSMSILDALIEKSYITENIFSLDNSNLYLGEMPLNRKEYKTCKIINLPEKFYVCEMIWNNIFMSKTFDYITPYRVLFKIEYAFINAPQDFFGILIGKYFHNLITESKKCTVKQIFMLIRWIECDTDINLDELEDISFSFRNDMNITLSARELFIKNENNGNLIFGIVYQVKEALLYDWIFGDIVLNKYSMFFDIEQKQIGICPQNISSISMIHQSPLIKIITLLNLTFLMFGTINNILSNTIINKY